MNTLFISINFYEYTNRIKDVIEKVTIGEVDEYCCTWPNSFIPPFFPKEFKNNIMEQYVKRKQQKFFQSINTNKYDIIFVLVGRGLIPSVFNDFIKSQPKSYKVIYLWDDVERINNFAEIKNSFDEIYSFDDYDCKKYGFRFLPLFYLDDYIYSGEHKCYDFSIIGQKHSYRESMLNLLMKQYPSSKFRWYALLNCNYRDYIKELIKRRRFALPKFIQMKVLSVKESSDVIKRSKVVVDMPHVTQHGLTMRTFEALASKTKLVTTNVAIKKYPFYCEENILVVDPKKPMIPISFLESEYKHVEEGIIQQYSLENWIRQIIDGS